MKSVLIDFQDSFTFNILHYLQSLGEDVTVVSNVGLDINELDKYDMIYLSPGPGLPSEKEHLFEIIEKYASSKKILGICLGMQAIVEFYGGFIYNLESVRHGTTTRVDILNYDNLFKGIPDKIEVGLYHSWACNIASTDELIPLAKSEDKVLMAVKHHKHSVFGLQFHPESILTPSGKQILVNFINFQP